MDFAPNPGEDSIDGMYTVIAKVIAHAQQPENDLNEFDAADLLVKSLERAGFLISEKWVIKC